MLRKYGPGSVDQVAYSATLSALQTGGRHRDCLGMFRQLVDGEFELQASELLPDAVACGAAMDAAASIEEWREVLRIFDAAEALPTTPTTTTNRGECCCCSFWHKLRLRKERQTGTAAAAAAAASRCVWWKGLWFGGDAGDARHRGPRLSVARRLERSPQLCHGSDLRSGGQGQGGGGGEGGRGERSGGEG